MGAGGAAGATLLPLRMEHEVVDDQLRSIVEQVDEAHRAVGADESVVLLDLDHGQVAALDVEIVPSPGLVLLLGQQLAAGEEPFVSGGDPGQAHRCSFCLRDGSVIFHHH